MEKRFRDLKKGDAVWIIDHWEVVEAKVKNTRETWYGQFYVYTTFSGWPCCGYSGSRRSGNMFVSKEDAYKQLRKVLEIRKETLENKIDFLVAEFDLLDSIQPPTEFSSTKPPSMKELKPGDSVWGVRKGEMEVKEVKITKIEACYNYIVVDTSLYAFHAFPNSTRSINWLFYTGEEQAWRYMLRWKNSRMKKVGKEMENLMKELENLEKHEEIWGLKERR